MICLTNLAGTTLWLNPELFERIEANPDTIIFLSTTASYRVRESPDLVIEKIIEFKKKLIPLLVNGKPVEG